MVHHRDAVGGQMDVELEAVGTRSHSQVKGGERVFGPEGASTAMSEHERTGALEEMHDPLISTVGATRLGS